MQETNNLDVVKWDRFRSKAYRIATINLDKNPLTMDTLNRLIDMWHSVIKPTKYLSYKEVTDKVRIEVGFNNFIEFYRVCVHLKSCGQTETAVLNYANSVLNKLGGM